MIKKYFVRNHINIAFVTGKNVQSFAEQIGHGYKNVTFTRSLGRFCTKEVQKFDVMIVDLATLHYGVFAAISKIKKDNPNIKIYASHNSVTTFEKLCQNDFGFNMPTLIRHLSNSKNPFYKSLNKSV